MSEHTPGPWRVPMIDGESTGILWGNEDKSVAIVCGSDAVMTANARLIAAAPDMLAELKRLRDVVGDEDASCIEAVIAHAEGRP